MAPIYDQLRAEAEKAEVDLAEACRRAGVARTTLYRWRTGSTSPRQGTINAITDKIEEIAAERAAA